MNVVDFLIALSLGLLGINTVFISIIYSMLPFHLKTENGEFLKWSIYPSEIVKNNKNSFVLLFGSLLFIYVYILLNEFLVLQNREFQYAFLKYVFLIFSSIFILIAILSFYKSVNIIWKDIIERTFSEQERIFFNKSKEEMRELYNRYNINLPNLLSVSATNTINKELDYFEVNNRKPMEILDVCSGLSVIYSNKIPIQRIEHHVNIENNELDELLAKLEKNNHIKIEDNFIILI